MQQADILSSHDAQLKAMQADIQDTQKLLSAIQSESLKVLPLAPLTNVPADLSMDFTATTAAPCLQWPAW